MTPKLRALFVSHGGGPMPLLSDPGHQEMVDCLQAIAAKIHKPSAIIVVSAHWEETLPTITSAALPPLIYDYFGFPPEAYSLKYPCVGEPVLATQVKQVLEKAGIDSKLDDNRGFDHGLFVPLSIMYPQADIPCIQLSLVKSLDPEQHINMGKALRALDYDNLLVVGSGFSFHNMQAFFAPQNTQSQALNVAFEQWLQATCSSKDMDEEQRALRFIQWAQAPGARYCHPREEHLLPLHVCYGLAGRACSEGFTLQILNKQASMYWW